MRMQMLQNLKAPTKKQQLLNWIKLRHYVFSHEIVAWSLDHKHIRALRDCRDFAAEENPPIKRLSKEEITLRWGPRKEGCYEYIGEKI